MSELAYDLDFYEPNEEWKKEDTSYYSEDRLDYNKKPQYKNYKCKARFSRAVLFYLKARLVLKFLLKIYRNKITINEANRGFKTVTKSELVLGHIFRNSKGHVNSLTNTSKNMYIDLFENVANNPSNFNSNVLTNYQRSVG